MTVRHVLGMLLLAAAIAGGLGAQPIDDTTLEDALRNLRAQPKTEDPEPAPLDKHGSETDRFREIGIGEFGINWAAFYTTRSYNVTDVRGLDNPWSGRYVPSFDFWGVGAACIVEYRVSADWRVTATHRVDLAYGIHNSPRHETHSLQTLPIKRDYLGAYDQQKLSFNLSFELAARWRYLWFVHDFDALLAFRRVKVKAYDSDYEDDQLGRLDFIKDRHRVDWDHIYKLGAGVGVGLDWFFVDEYARFTTILLWRPWTWVNYRDAGGFTNGFEFIIRSSPFELSNHIGVFFEFSVQMYLPVHREFSQIYYTQFSIGCRFR